MKIELLQANVVILAQGHNPTILHPSFLEAMEIVDRSWKAAQDQILTTPAVSKVRYDVGIEFLVTGDRLQILDHQPTEDRLLEGLIGSLAARYMRALPHVAYTAVGFNFIGLLLKPDPGPYIRDTFIATGPWLMDDLKLAGAEVKLFYEIADDKLQVTVGPATTGTPPEIASAKVGVMSNFNYHHDLNRMAAIEDALHFLETQPKLARDFLTRARAILKDK